MSATHEHPGAEPHAPVPPAADPHRSARWGAGRVALQIGGFAVGIALLCWAIRSAFASPEQRAQLERMLHLPWWQTAALVVLSIATVSLDGLVFRTVLMPVRTLRKRDLVAVAGVCSALSYLPFKMSVLFRVFYHRRHDGLSVLTTGSWILAAAAVLLASLVPVAVAGALAKPGPLWWSISLGGTIFLSIVGHALARVLARDSARGFFARLATSVGVRWPERFLAGAAFGRLWAGVHMLADALAFAKAMALRTLIVACQGLRFYLAARWLGVDLPIEHALFAGGAYNFLQAVAPTGVGGLREWGASGALAMLGTPGMMAVVLAITATEAATNLAMGLGGGAYLRLDRLLTGTPSVRVT